MINWFFEYQLAKFSVILSFPFEEDVKMIRTSYIFIFCVYFALILANDIRTLASKCFNIKDSLENSAFSDQIERCDTKNYATEVIFLRKKKFYCISYKYQHKNESDQQPDRLDFTTRSIFDLEYVSYGYFKFVE